MPKGTKVERCYQQVKGQTGDKGKAARICQASTGQSLATGRKTRKKKK